ncbi:23S rRNA (uracil(1939)-C(5))-methyltransferase RlmD [Alicyclobacillus cycloheptanicus]|uniref:23S rRNA (Uracil1939-C5)-methyltransferase n=2 Tax=Alicyclobacillus cycloheptanicus TaxID=1457 RepID=A0ABT9XH43_9BACL|nr:23S rRNA (uracil(1939)-C(5))-methyltransferase RlmD [Alicyclobacillus cycloheptanicus]MDQ0189629.1 23S rRNA (uracil1939-C5)-methyltransferase [Alicyclobacillus cycloheptanicus]
MEQHMQEGAAPPKVGSRFDVEALRLNDDGDGVARVDGWTVFVPNLLPGERARIEIVSVDKQFARARVEERVQDAEARITPACPVHAVCGGCQLQHLAYAAQLRHKQRVVAEVMARVAKLPDVPVRPTLGMAKPWRYRNQVQVPVEYDAKARRLRLGFFAPNSHRLVETEVCALEPEAMERVIAAAAERLVQTLGADAAAVHHVIVRRSRSTGDILVVLAVRDAGVDLTQAGQALLTLPQVVGVARTVQSRRGGPVWGKRVEMLCGASSITETILGIEYLISPRSFFQVNPEQAEVLYTTALAYAQLKATDTVLDAYCGTGSISLLLARAAKRVVGIESVPDAIADARRNAAHNGIANASFHVGEVERVLPRLLQRGERFDVAVLDPPRKGCHPAVIEALVDAKPQRIVYVSCNHATLARDLRRLADGGYDAAEIQPVDMFPQTSHIEVVVSLRRAKEDPAAVR